MTLGRSEAEGWVEVANVTAVDVRSFVLEVVLPLGLLAFAETAYCIPGVFFFCRACIVRGSRTSGRRQAGLRWEM